MERDMPVYIWLAAIVNALHGAAVVSSACCRRVIALHRGRVDRQALQERRMHGSCVVWTLGRVFEHIAGLCDEQDSKEASVVGEVERVDKLWGRISVQTGDDGLIVPPSAESEQHLCKDCQSALSADRSSGLTGHHDRHAVLHMM